MPPERPEPPGAVEAGAAAIAGLAFAGSLLFVRAATPLDAALFDGGAALALALGLSLATHRRLGPVAATSLRGAGGVAFVLLSTRALVPPYYALVFPGTLAAAGLTVIQANARRDAPTLGADGLGGAALAGAFAFALLVAGDVPEGDRLRLALVLAAAFTAMGLVARRVLLAADRRALAPTPVGVVLVSAIAGGYLGYRGLVEQRLGNLPLYEWSLAAAMMALALGRLRARAKADASADAWSGDAHRHAQDARPVYDGRMGGVAAAVARWLSRGDNYDAYRAAMEAHAGEAPPRAFVDALDAARAFRRKGPRTPAARRRVDGARHAAHQAAMDALTTTRRTTRHADPQPVRTHP